MAGPAGLPGAAEPRRRDLYVAVLDLTDRFRCHAVVPTRPAGGRTHAGAERRRPDPGDAAGRRARSSRARSVRDWLKVIVSDVDFDATSFTMPQLDDPPPAVSRGRAALDARAARRRGGAAATSAPACDAARATPVAEWAASTLVLEVRVPTALTSRQCSQ